MRDDGSISQVGKLCVSSLNQWNPEGDGQFRVINSGDTVWTL